MSWLIRFARALRHPNFAVYAAGNVLNLIGHWMQRIAVGWLTWQLTESATWLGIMTLAELGPTLLIGPLGGVLADRYPRIRIAQATQIAAAVQAGMLALLTLSGQLGIWSLLLLMLLQGVIFSLWQPVRLALISSLVPREDLGSAVALNSVIFNSARFIGPALAGVFLVAGGAGWVFVLHACGLLGFWFALSRLHIKEEPVLVVPGRRFGGELLDGIRHVIRHPGMGPVLVLLIASCLLMRPVFELLPGFAEAVFQRGAHGLAILAAAPGVGAVLGGIWLGQRSSLIGLTRLMLQFTVVLAVVLMVFALTHWFWLAVLCLGLAGSALTVSGAGTQTLIQTAVDNAYRGRVLSLYGMVLRAGPAVGALIMGATGDLIGLRWPLLTGCVLCLLVLFWVNQRREQIRASLENP